MPKRTPVSANIVAFVEKKGSATAVEIGKHLKRDPKYLSSALSTLVANEKLTRIERGVYAPFVRRLPARRASPRNAFTVKLRWS